MSRLVSWYTATIWAIFGFAFAHVMFRDGLWVDLVGSYGTLATELAVVATVPIITGLSEVAYGWIEIFIDRMWPDHSAGSGETDVTS